MRRLAVLLSVVASAASAAVAHDLTRAQWISAPEGEQSFAFETSFVVDQPVRIAILNVTGLGFYEAYLNGRKIGDRVLEPSPTDYTKRILYSSYRLTELVNGTNVLRIVLGHGWYDMRSHAVWNFDTAPWRDRPKAIAQLEMEMGDGLRRTIGTDGTWELVESPIAYDCLREGEVFDGRRMSWRRLGRKAIVAKAPRGVLVPNGEFPAAKVQSRIPPEKLSRLHDGRWLVTFPEAISGWVSLTMRGLKRDDVISIRYDENLADDGGPAMSSQNDLGAAHRPGRRSIDCFFVKPGSGGAFPGETGMQYDRFISGGRAVELFEPRFVYHGFRHVLISGLREGLAENDIRAVSVRTDFKERGSFECSDERLTELVRMAKNSYKANFTDGIPTDCPHREKLGWTGDAWIASEVGLRYFDSGAAYKKWYADVIDTQLDSGRICAIAPTSGWGYDEYAGPVFDAVIGELPWNLWMFCGDRQIIESAYDPLKKYLAYAQSRENSPGLIDFGLGDWNAYDKQHMPAKEFVVSCFYLRLKEIAAKFASIRERDSDRRTFESSARQTREAIIVKYGKENGVFDNGGQTAQALAIMFGLCDPASRDSVAARLVESVEKTDCHVDFGLVGARYVYRALSEIGRSDLACRMIVNPSEPSMTKWIGKNGTLWEDWRNGFSKCHVMLSDFAAWCQGHLAGITPEEPGYRRIRIKPEMVCGLEWVKARASTPCGDVEVWWRRKEEMFQLDVDVPHGSTALIVMPDGTMREVLAGAHGYRCDLKK